jgi:hypothetical protein
LQDKSIQRRSASDYHGNAKQTQRFATHPEYLHPIYQNGLTILEHSPVPAGAGSGDGRLLGGIAFMAHRGADRTSMVVPVKVLATDSEGLSRTMLAHTLDANTAGVRLGGVHQLLAPGQTVTVQYQHRRCQFCVVWIGERGTPQSTQVGLRCLDPGKNIWGVNLPGRSAEPAPKRRTAFGQMPALAHSF